MPRFKSIIFYQYSPKIKLFLKKKCKIFKRWGLRPQTPNNLWQLGALPPNPLNGPRNCEFLAMCCPRFALCIIVWGFVAFVLNNFFFTHSVANLMMFTTDVCLMLVFCFKSFICITHCVTLTPFCYITLSYLFAKV